MNQAMLYALAAIAMWASVATLSALTHTLPPFFVAGVGLILGSLLTARRVKEWKVPPKNFANGVYGIFGFYFFLFNAYRLAPVMDATVLSYVWPLLMVLLSPLLLPGTRLGANHILGSLIGFAGAALIVTGGKLSLSMSALPGYLMAFGAAVVWATYSLFTRRLPATSDNAVGGYCFASGLLALGLHFATEPAAHPSSVQWLMIAVLGLLPMGAAFLCWNRAMQLGDPRQTGALGNATPLLSTLMLVASGQAALDGSAALAIAMIVGGAALGTLPAERLLPGWLRA
ncbi:DMT family transporter [Chromobacterium violaceum]|uniref:DMT family transporter n=1 Tax=Chromobacterium violaceum TaxID=536 RepID=UPI0009DB6AFC|nr:DMT family transporter [Chromobacterium violaceum]OQS47650.1 EamA family transporter [Chromobacterium violaceum]OQS49534.1 EamA family transporter [Chromobacterium violaceum]QRO34333.1 DMT family transporter [Chromobacterium violaceum]QRQ15864.1 DMT family transporter [Chromobacterium violaceum]